MPTRHLLIKGKVQGVFYRASARDAAVEMGLTGWVKNTPEGHVEATITGAASQLEAFSKWCWQGPSRSVVADVEVIDMVEISFDSFRILR